MNILFDINHPAHVHLFKNAIRILKEKGHRVVITSRDKDVTISLLDNLHLQHTVLSKAQKGLLGLGLELIWRQLRLLPILLKNKIHVCVSVTGACNVHICKLLRIPTLVFYDTEHAKLQNQLALPFVTKFYTPESFQGRLGKRHITYKGFHDLAYLHPRYFTPDPKIYQLLGLSEGEKYVVIRFVSWQAAHDTGQRGMSWELKRKVIETCLQYAKVFVVSESPELGEFAKYQLKVTPEKIHDVLAFANLYIGEGGSMASEAAILGTPALFVNTLRAGVLDSLENRFQLLFNMDPREEDISPKIQELLSQDSSKQLWQQRRNKFLQQTVDVTQWMVDEILKNNLSTS